MTVAEIEQEIVRVINENNKLYDEKKIALISHRSYCIRKTYYPARMDAWLQEEERIKMVYDVQLKELLTSFNQLKKNLKAEKEIQEAAQSLLCLHKQAMKESKRKEKTPTEPVEHVLRRSCRFMSDNRGRRGSVCVKAYL
jgi:hypothetical protein